MILFLFFNIYFAEAIAAATAAATAAAVAAGAGTLRRQRTATNLVMPTVDLGAALAEVFSKYSTILKIFNNSQNILQFSKYSTYTHTRHIYTNTAAAVAAGAGTQSRQCTATNLVMPTVDLGAALADVFF